MQALASPLEPLPWSGKTSAGAFALSGIARLLFSGRAIRRLPRLEFRKREVALAAHDYGFGKVGSLILEQPPQPDIAAATEPSAKLRRGDVRLTCLK